MLRKTDPGGQVLAIAEPEWYQLAGTASFRRTGTIRHPVNQSVELPPFSEADISSELEPVATIATTGEPCKRGLLYYFGAGFTPALRTVTLW